MAARGALHLELAALYGDQHDAEHAYEFLAQARADADKLGSEDTYDTIQFGPSTVSLREAGIALSLGHPEHAKTVLLASDTSVKPVLQQVRYWVLRCRIEAQLGNISCAIQAADQACDLAPAVANDPKLRRVVTNLLAANTKHRGDVRTLGRRIGVL